MYAHITRKTQLTIENTVQSTKTILSTIYNFLLKYKFYTTTKAALIRFSENLGQYKLRSIIKLLKAPFFLKNYSPVIPNILFHLSDLGQLPLFSWKVLKSRPKVYIKKKKQKEDLLTYLVNVIKGICLVTLDLKGLILNYHDFYDVLK